MMNALRSLTTAAALAFAVAPAPPIMGSASG